MLWDHKMVYIKWSVL